MTLRTSASDPIRVDFVARRVLRAPGRLGLTIAPGKRDGARWERDLDLDLRRLRRTYRAAMLVSLVEEPERQMLQIPDLHDRARARGLEVRALPIRDVSVPTRAQLGDVRTLVLDINAALDAGKTVVIHCRGGLGRAGLLAACVLKARGLAAPDAIAAVRAARPGAIETAEQAAWVTSFPPAQPDQAMPDGTSIVDRPHIDLDAVPEPHAAAPDAPPLDRVLGCMLGGALGDALGYPIEFITSHAAIVDRFGARAPARLAYAGGPAHVSDDTQMTMFVAEGLIRALQRGRERGICNPHAVGLRALLRWYATQTDATATGDWPGWLVQDRRLHVRRAPGTTCMSALAARARADEIDLEPAPNNSKGCGGVMRAAPFGFLPSRDDAFEHAVTNARLTHGHPTGSLAAGYLAAVIWDLARGIAPTAALDQADAILTTQPAHDETARAVDRARAIADGTATIDAPTLERLGGGWVAEEALAIALVCFLHHTRSAATVADTLWLAACHGGDSDSTAAITGNLLGTMLGAASLPDRWLADLELRDALERLARDFWTAFFESRFLDTGDYPPN